MLRGRSEHADSFTHLAMFAEYYLTANQCSGFAIYSVFFVTSGEELLIAIHDVSVGMVIISCYGRVKGTDGEASEGV